MIIYVATSSKEIDRAERIIARLRELGHTISFDWPAHIRANPGGANTGTDEQLEEAAELCLRGALDAELVWVANPPVDKTTAGAWGEMIGAVVFARIRAAGEGYPTGLSTPRVIISAPSDPSSGAPLLKQFCIFQHLKGVTRLDNDEQAFTYIQQLENLRPDDRSPRGS